MLEIEEAREQLTRRVKQVQETETVAVFDAVGRVLAEDVYAAQDQPPFPRSPLDGYAVRGKDTHGASFQSPAVLRVIGSICAGSVFPGTVGAGEAVRIMTGAPIPGGADAVVRQEESDYGEAAVKIYRFVSPYENYCYQGEDYKQGDLLLKKGTRINGAVLSLLAGQGRGQVLVYRRARVAVFSSGDELVMPGNKLLPGKIYNTNLPMIVGRMTEFGTPPVMAECCPDDAALMAGKIKKMAPETDLIITTGGVSVGQKDIMHEVVRLLEAEVLFWKVRIKPGTPTLAAAYRGTLMICLSGNPYAAAVNFELLARPVIGVLTGDARWDLEKRKAVLQNDSGKCGGVRRFVRGYVEHGRVWTVSGNHSSGAIASLARSNCLIEILPEKNGGCKGTEAWVYLL